MKSSALLNAMIGKILLFLYSCHTKDRSYFAHDLKIDTSSKKVKDWSITCVRCGYRKEAVPSKIEAELGLGVRWETVKHGGRSSVG